MLISLPNSEDEKVIERWKATNRLTFDIFKAFWQEGSPHLPMPGSEAGDEASYLEWEGKADWGNDCKYFGMRNAAGQKSGIVRMVSRMGIEEATFFEDELHGLYFKCLIITKPAFMAEIFEHGKIKASIEWRQDWSEY